MYPWHVEKHDKDRVNVKIAIKLSSCMPVINITNFTNAADIYDDEVHIQETNQQGCRLTLSVCQTIYQDCPV